MIAFAFHTWNLARRIPDDELADELQTVMLGFLAALLLTVIAVVVSETTIAGTGPAVLVYGLISLAGLGTLLFEVWTVVLMLRLAAALRDAARYASAAHVG